MNTKCTTKNGGCVEFNPQVTVSSNVAGVPGSKKCTTYMFLKKEDKRSKKTAQVFFNTETGLLVIDVIDQDGRGGTEIIRQKIL